MSGKLINVNMEDLKAIQHNEKELIKVCLNSEVFKI